jgi:WD40 repeat protein
VDILFISFYLLLLCLILLQIEGHDDDVNTVAFADSTSQILYSGGDDGLCKVFVIVIYI